jgi:hypothetical protein
MFVDTGCSVGLNVGSNIQYVAFPYIRIAWVILGIFLMYPCRKILVVGDKSSEHGDHSPFKMIQSPNTGRAHE